MRDLMRDVRRYYHVVAPFLDAELSQRGDEDFWRQIGAEHAGGSILEIGCGTGRVTGLLAASPARVVGIDICPEMLDLARQRLREVDRGLASTQHLLPNTQLVLADMRDLAFGATFDAVVAPDDPFSHLLSGIDRDRALASLAGVLPPGARFILDALWFRPENERRAGAAALLVERDFEANGGQLHVTESWHCNPRSHRCSTEFAYDDGAHPPTRAHFQARYWSLSELRRRFRRAGLRITACWGGFERQPWDERLSKHLVIEARRLQP